MKKEDGSDRRRIYPDAGLSGPKGEFRNMLLETVRDLFPKLPGR